VFQIEQGVDPTLEFDRKDDAAQHLLAYRNQKPVATARVRFLDAQTAKVERVAVLSQERGKGIGRIVMNYILTWLGETQVTQVWINAQEPVRVFYEKLGFESDGDIFEEAGIPHIRMRKLLH
jgi:predicted GNAT family N-acyltransferase